MKQLWDMCERANSGSPWRVWSCAWVLRISLITAALLMMGVYSPLMGKEEPERKRSADSRSSRGENYGLKVLSESKMPLNWQLMIGILWRVGMLKCEESRHLEAARQSLMSTSDGSDVLAGNYCPKKFQDVLAETICELRCLSKGIKEGPPWPFRVELDELESFVAAYIKVLEDFQAPRLSSFINSHGNDEGRCRLEQDIHQYTVDIPGLSLALLDTQGLARAFLWVH